MFLTRSSPPRLELTGCGSQPGCLGARWTGPLGSWEGAGQEAEGSLSGPRVRLGAPGDTSAELQLSARARVDSRVPALRHLRLPRLLRLLKKAAFTLLLKCGPPGHAGSHSPSEARGEHAETCPSWWELSPSNPGGGACTVPGTRRCDHVPRRSRACKRGRRGAEAPGLPCRAPPGAAASGAFSRGPPNPARPELPPPVTAPSRKLTSSRRGPGPARGAPAHRIHLGLPPLSLGQKGRHARVNPVKTGGLRGLAFLLLFFECKSS